MKLRLDHRKNLLALLVLLCAAPAMAANGSAEAPFRFYTVLDGLTQSAVIDIEQDQAGYLWFTTARGLNRYDGREFDQFTIADGLPVNSLTALHVSATNTVWVGDARGGVTIVHGARVVHTVEPNAEMDGPVLDIEIVDDRKFAVMGSGEIAEIVSDETGYRIEHLVGNEVSGITGLSVHGRDVWVESQNGLYRLTYEGEPGLELMSESIRKIHTDSTGALWVVDDEGAVGTWQDDKFDEVARIESEYEIVSLVIDNDGLAWVATSHELYSFNARREGAEYGAPYVKRYPGIDNVTSLFVDSENSLWLSSASRLIRFLGDRFRHFRLRTEFDSETVWAISEDRHGRFWFGTQTKLLMRQHDESLIVVGKEHGLPGGPVRDVVADDDGNLWLGISGHGLFRFAVDAMTATHVRSSGNAKILDIELPDDGSIWFSTLDSGVYRYQPHDESMTVFETPEGTSVYSLDAWVDGSVWYGADEVGLVRLAPDAEGGFEQTIIGEGGSAPEHDYSYVRLNPLDDGGYEREILNPEDGLLKRYFNQIIITGADSAWIATEEGGLIRFENARFTDVGEVTPLADQTVYLVEPLDNGTVVVGGEQGLYHFIPGVPGIAHYNQQAGFIGLETNVHATFVDSGGSLWIGTVDGAARMDVSQPMPPSFLPKPTIVRMEAAQDGRQILDGGEIEPNELGAQLEYAAISLLNPQGVQYSYKLDGVDSEWGSATSNRSVSYPRIPPGSYEFLVRARYTGGQWSDAIASHRFTVLPFFWQQPWFMFGTFLLFIILLRSVMVYRTRKIEWMNETLRAQVEERTESIEKARQKLLVSNERLSQEIGARAEVETRFRRAFENAPIGMGLLDVQGKLFDANPALNDMFWPDVATPPDVRFAETIGDEDRERFELEYQKLIKSVFDNLDEKLACVGPDGDALQAVVNLSAVRSDTGEFLYSVLQIQDVTESLQLTVKLEYQASYDELTGLLNRRAFEAQLEKAWESRGDSSKQSHLMFMDLDQFKVVNDTSGHTAGDQLLRSISEILVDNVRANDIVGRLGGDEFGIILWDCPADVARRIAENIRQSIENFRFHWDVETYRIGVSIGGLPIDPAVGDISELQQLADAACYAAKEAGRNRVHMVSGDKDSARVHRGQVRWVQRLREAMEKNRFAIYGQQIRPIDENSNEPERIEILLRLRDPETRKLIPPGAFLPAAERYGLSVELDKWVVKSLLDMLYVHHAFEAEHRSYWINLSGSSVGDRRFAEFLTDAVRNSPLPPGTINFEITETAVIRSIAEAGDLMSSLREMGCRFALDDFGSGLSSFGYLKKLPVDYVKIDGMFIRDLLKDKTDRIFVKSIIDIAHTLGIKTIAEFVENNELLGVVRDLGADYIQGFVVGQPFVLAPRFPRTAGSEQELAEIHSKAG